MASLVNKEIRPKGNFFIIQVSGFFTYLLLKKDEKSQVYCLLKIISRKAKDLENPDLIVSDCFIIR